MRHVLVLAVALALVACVRPFGAPPPTVPSETTPTMVGFATLAVTSTAPRPTVAPTPAPATPTLSAPTLGERITLRDLPGAGRSPRDMVILGDKLYVANSETDNLAVIQNGRVAKYIAVGKRPGALAVDSAQNRLYVANDDDKTINLIVDDVIVRTIGIGDSIGAMVFIDKYVYAGTKSKGTVLVLDPVTLQTFLKITIPNAEEVINLAADADRHQLYVNTYRSIAVVDTKTWKILNTFKAGGYYTLAALPQKGLVLTNGYDADYNNQYLISYDPRTGKEVGRTKIGSDPRGTAVNADGTRAFVANAYTNDVSVVDPIKMTTLATIPVGMQPQFVALDGTNRRLYVSNSESDSVCQIDLDRLQVVATIPVAMLTTAMVSNESTGRLYLANASTDSVYVVEGAKIVREIVVGRHPVDLARDEASNRIFVANEGERTLSIIDESDLTVRTTDVITRYVSTVAVDNSRGRVYVNDVVMDLKTLKPVDQLLMRPYMVYGRSIPPDWIRVHPASKRIYLVAWNGTPGSNSRSVVYSVSGDSLEASAVLANYGNTTALAFDGKNGRTFLAATHPLAYTNDFAVFDDKDNRVGGIAMPARTVSMVYNPQTHHLFLSHMESLARSYGPTPVPANDLLEILDADTLGRVSQISLKAPGYLGRVGNTIYVASRADGTVTLVQDANTAPPPSPTPTRGPTPFPTGTGTPAGQKPTPTITIAPQPTRASCPINPPPALAQKIAPQTSSRLGCAIEPAKDVYFAVQMFQNAQMFWREDEKRIYILYSDKTWAAYDDMWTSGMPEDSCPAVTMAAGRIKPVRGFGRIWCGTSGVRAKAGDGTTPEIGLYSAPAEKFERGRIFGGPAGQVFALYSDARWE